MITRSRLDIAGGEWDVFGSELMSNNFRTGGGLRFERFERGQACVLIIGLLYRSS